MTVLRVRGIGLPEGEPVDLYAAGVLVPLARHVRDRGSLVLFWQH